MTLGHLSSQSITSHNHDNAFNVFGHLSQLSLFNYLSLISQLSFFKHFNHLRMIYLLYPSIFYSFISIVSIHNIMTLLSFSFPILSFFTSVSDVNYLSIDVLRFYLVSILNHFNFILFKCLMLFVKISFRNHHHLIHFFINFNTFIILNLYLTFLESSTIIPKHAFIFLSHVWTFFFTTSIFFVK